MTSASTRKALRDLGRQRAQVAAVAVTIMLGVGLFISSAGAFANLTGSYQRTYDRLHFADLVAVTADPGPVARAAGDAGAAAVTVRTVVDPPMSIGGTKLVGRVVGLPAGHRPAVDDVEVTAGDYLSPGSPAGVLVETHAAQTFGLSPGDRVEVHTPQGWREVTVRGVAVSAEYLWPARSRQEVLGDPHGFAVLFAPEPTVRSWSGAGAGQVLVELPRGPEDPRAGAVAEAMRAAGATDVTTQAEQPSAAALQLDLDGFSQMSVAFPLLFLTAAALAAYVLLTRRVRAERPLIGALMASGARRSRLVRHYLLQGLLIGLAGTVAGVVFGLVVTGPLTRAYTGELGIPDTVVSSHLGLAVVGLAVGVAVGVLGAAAPAVTAARTAPAEAMRNQTVARDPGWWSRTVSRLEGLPVTARMALRDVVRSRRRTAVTALGSVLALVLVLASVGLMTSMTSALARQYDDVERQDATVTVAPRAAPAVGDALRGMAGVTSAEPSIVGPVTVSAGGGSYSTTLQGFSPDTRMHRFPAAGGASSLPAGDGVLAGSALAEDIDVAVGDRVTLTTPDGRSARVTLDGFVDEPLGTSVYATDALAERVLAGSGAATYLVRYDAGADRNRMRQAVTALEGVVAYADTDAVVRSLDQFLGLFWAFVGIMVLLGAVLALAIIYVTMAVTVVERTGELATLRASGVPVRRVAGTLAAQNMVAALLGLPVGLALGVLAADRFLGMFTSDMFRLPLSLPWWTLLLAASGVVLAAALSQGPAVRAVRRLDVARVVRERAP